MSYKLVSSSQPANALVDDVMALELWPAHPGLLVYPNTVLNSEAGITLWRGHEDQNSTFHGIWRDEFDWTAAILIDDSVGDRAREVPGIFTWLFGHELGHAVTAAQDWRVFSCQVFVQSHIGKASGGAVTTWLQIPFEESLDQFALHVVEALGLREVLLAEIDAGLHSNLRVDPERVIRLRDLEAIEQLPDPRVQLAEFVAPYRDELRTLWISAAEREGPSFVGAGITFDEML